MQNNIVYYNWKYSYYKNIHIGLLSNSLNFWTWVLDSIRLYKINGSIYSIGLYLYYERFLASVNNYIYDFYIDYKEFESIIIKLLKLNKDLENPYLRLLIFQGDETLDMNKNTFNFAIIPISLKVPYSKLNWLVASNYRNSDEIYKYKLSFLYWKNFYQNNFGKKTSNDVFIFVDKTWNLLECFSENIFIVINNIIYTPPTENILSGINRQVIISYLTTCNIKVKEEYINLNEISEIDEILICWSATWLRSLISINWINIKWKNYFYYDIINKFFQEKFINYNKIWNIIINKLL